MHCFRETFRIVAPPLEVWVEEWPSPDTFGLIDATSNAAGDWPKAYDVKTTRPAVAIARIIILLFSMTPGARLFASAKAANGRGIPRSNGNPTEPVTILDRAVPAICWRVRMSSRQSADRSSSFSPAPEDHRSTSVR